MRQVLQHTPQTPLGMPTRNLLEEKIQFYSAAASRLYFDDGSTAQSIVPRDPRSPLSIGQQQFFSEEPSVPPPPPAIESPRFTQTVEFNQKASQANTKLSRAIELDESGKTKEAADAYMSAAELYLESIRLCEKCTGSSAIAPVLTRRLEGAMDRIEQLKHPNRLVVKQPKAGEDAYSRQSRETSFTKEEIAVLKRSSLIASGIFLPWSDEDAHALSLRVQKTPRPSTLFTDKDGDLVLSDKQQNKFHRWARPNEIVQMRKSFGGKQSPPTMIRSINPYSIRQQYVTDCSFIASLCICAAFENRFRKRLITSIIYPQNHEGIPVYNPEGKYIVKLWLNGVARQVIVDDRLPIDRNSNLMCSHTTGNRNKLELWVTIIEKAYMKLCGGYDFPGSNSGVDLFSLTGWIPERIFFSKDPHKIRDFETAPERAWERLFSANSFGDCLITVSTSRDITEEQAEASGLVTGHAYAVLDVFQAKDGTRLLQMKNPWASKASLSHLGRENVFIRLTFGCFGHCVGMERKILKLRSRRLA
jgi:calpain-7